jgi:formate C-acetyltransferase
MKDCGCNISAESVNRETWTHGATDRVNKLRDQYWSHMPTIDTERAVSYTKSYKKNEGKDVCIKRASALYDYMSERTICIQPHELIVGTYGRQPRAVLVCPEILISWYKNELDTMSTRPQDPYQISEEDKEILKSMIFPYWEGKTMEDYYIANLNDEIKSVAFNTGIVFGENKSQAGAGEFSAGYRNIILKKGFKGIKEEAAQKLNALDPEDIKLFDKRMFYESVILSCDAVKVLADRYASKALELSKTEKDPERHKELTKIADICLRVPFETPKTFHEAIQAVWFTQILLFTEENTTSFTIDRPDQYLYPFYKKDLEEGRITKTEAQELLECLWIKMAEIIYAISEESSVYYSGYQPFHGLTIGGIQKNGEHAINDISYMALQATMDTRMHVPTINVRVNDNTPDEFLMKVCDLVELGTGQPAIFFDKNAMAILRRNGVQEEDLWDWCVAGCVEPQIPGKTSLWDEGGRYSYATAVEWALFNGYSKILGRRIGLETGDPRNFKSYAEFEDAVDKQLAFMIKMACLNCQIIERAHQIRMPKPVRSLCVEGCIEAGIDAMSGGAKYNLGPGIEATGVADLADSMAAVKKLVYEDQVMDMSTLIDVLENDFEGHEDIHQLLINGAPKYGNDDDYVDEIASKFVAASCDYCAQYVGLNGSKFLNGVVPVIANLPHGLTTWALPSGRKATVPLADGISPYVGYDKNGPSSVLKSVCKVDHIKNGVGTLLNVRLSPSLIKSVTDKKNLISLLKSEGDMGGYHVQFNVVSTETLRQAQKAPENYTDLLVRIAGYSAYFVELRKDAQESIIARTENKSW